VKKKYFKTHLVPFGEYIPFQEYIGFIKKHIDKPIGDYARGKEYTLFTLKTEMKNEILAGAITRAIKFNKIGVMICFEDVFPLWEFQWVLRRLRMTRKI